MLPSQLLEIGKELEQAHLLVSSKDAAQNRLAESMIEMLELSILASPIEFEIISRNDGHFPSRAKTGASANNALALRNLIHLFDSKSSEWKLYDLASSIQKATSEKITAGFRTATGKFSCGTSLKKFRVQDARYIAFFSASHEDDFKQLASEVDLLSVEIASQVAQELRRAESSFVEIANQEIECKEELTQQESLPRYR